jgi:predicted Rossmann fold flavoprotein
MAAISAARHAPGNASAPGAGPGIVLLEGTARIGTKILMSGGTRCNVTHDYVDARDYNGGSRNVVARLLREFSHEDAARFFTEELGIALKREDTGKLFPASDDAAEVRDALVTYSEAAGVRILLERKVTAIERAGAGAAAAAAEDASVARFRLSTAAGETFGAHAVVLTTGGLSYPRTGSDGVGYGLAQSLGHSLVRTSPALTPLVASGNLHERLKGVTLPVRLTVHVAGRKHWQSTGSFLFAHFGYSGPVALDASRHVVREGWHAPVEVFASFLPEETPESLEAQLLAEAKTEPRRTIASALRGRLPESVLVELLHEAGIDREGTLGYLSREDRKRAVRVLCEFRLPVIDVMGYRKAEVTAGGVPVAEVNPSTMESRITPGLFFAGEILDVEGRLGGYNFQWAWSTGWVAGRGAARGSRNVLPGDPNVGASAS